MWRNIKDLIRGKKASIFSAIGLTLTFLVSRDCLDPDVAFYIAGLFAAFGVTINASDAIEHKRESRQATIKQE